MHMASSCTTTEVILNNTLNTIPICYRWKPGLREAKRFGQGPHNQEAMELGRALDLLTPRPRLLSLALERGTSSPQRGMRMLGSASPEDRSTP